MQQLLDRLEAIKNKGLTIGVSDLEQLIRLYDDIGTIQIETKSKYIEDKNELDNQKAIMYEKLKAEEVETEDAKGNVKMKSKYTDEGCKSMIKQSFQEESNNISVTAATVDLLEHKKSVTEHYINLTKIIIK